MYQTLRRRGLFDWNSALSLLCASPPGCESPVLCIQYLLQMEIWLCQFHYVFRHGQHLFLHRWRFVYISFNHCLRFDVCFIGLDWQQVSRIPWLFFWRGRDKWTNCTCIGIVKVFFLAMKIAFRRTCFDCTCIRIVELCLRDICLDFWIGHFFSCTMQKSPQILGSKTGKWNHQTSIERKRGALWTRCFD